MRNKDRCRHGCICCITSCCSTKCNCNRCVAELFRRVLRDQKIEEEDTCCTCNCSHVCENDTSGMVEYKYQDELGYPVGLSSLNFDYHMKQQVNTGNRGRRVEEGDYVATIDDYNPVERQRGDKMRIYGKVEKSSRYGGSIVYVKDLFTGKESIINIAWLSVQVSGRKGIQDCCHCRHLRDCKCQSVKGAFNDALYALVASVGINWARRYASKKLKEMSKE